MSQQRSRSKPTPKHDSDVAPLLAGREEDSAPTAPDISPSPRPLVQVQATPSCSTCRHWLAKRGVHGICRMNPNSIVHTPTEFGPLCVQPVTLSSDYCSYHSES